jgi:hybrid cluster-associated redox disulfide protein
MAKEKITKEMKIEEILQKHPQTVEIFLKHGFHCLGCAAASFENLEEGAKTHGIDVDKIVEELNRTTEEKEQKSKEAK